MKERMKIMQDEINYKVVMLAIRLGKDGARLTERALRSAIRKLMEFDDRIHEVDSVKHGKQSFKELMEQNAGASSIEITDNNIRSFERIAKKYHIDFALKKDKTQSPPRYLVFFKGRDADVMTAAFREYAAKSMDKARDANEKQQNIQRGRNHQKERIRTRHKRREIER